MTIDSPNDPERESRPEDSGSAPSGYTCVFTHAPGLVLCDFCKPVESEVERLTAEVARLQRDLAEWTSGRRRKSWPRIESVPDGIHYAAELVRAQGTEGGDEHDQLLREASQRLKALHDIAQVLLADRTVRSDLLRGMARRVDEWRRTSATHYAEFHQAVEDWGRNDEQMLAENQRLANELARVQDELVTQNRLYRKVGAERDEKQFEIERLRRWVDRFRERLATAVVLPPDAVDRAAMWLFRAKTSQLLPDVLQRASKTWHRVLDQQDRDAWISYAREMLMDLGLSAPVSGSVPATPEQVGGVVKRDTLHGKEDGAETFVQLEPGPPGFVVPQKNEGRPSGSGRRAPHPGEEWCEECQDYVSGSHYHCAKCGQRSSMMGHSFRPCPTESPEDAAQAARSEATPNLQITNEINTSSSPPSGGDSDTTPRTSGNEWMCRDCGHPENPFDTTDNSWMCDRHKASVRRVWRKGDAEPADHPVVQDCHGDVWTWVPGTHEWSSPETQNCAWSYMARKWAPLTEVLPSLPQEGGTDG